MAAPRTLVRTVPHPRIKRERGAAIIRQRRGCPRNCKRRAFYTNSHWRIARGRPWKAMTREPGDLPSQSDFPIAGGDARGSV